LSLLLKKNNDVLRKITVFVSGVRFFDVTVDAGIVPFFSEVGGTLRVSSHVTLDGHLAISKNGIRDGRHAAFLFWDVPALERLVRRTREGAGDGKSGMKARGSDPICVWLGRGREQGKGEEW
jgi:hypothetical protein